MATSGRRSVSGPAKRPAAAAASENTGGGTGTAGKVGSVAQAKKRAALGNLTNQPGRATGGHQPLQSVSKSAANAISHAPTTAAKVANRTSSASIDPAVKRKSVSRTQNTSLRNSLVTSSSVKPTSSLPLNDACKANYVPPATATEGSVFTATTTSISSLHGYIAPCNNPLSPSTSAGGSVSVDETMSTCDSLNSPDIEYIDNADSSGLASLERRASENLRISEIDEEEGYTCKRDFLMDMRSVGVVDVDNNHDDPQLCASLASDIYKHLRLAETKKRPAADFIEATQKDINASMRAILVDWLVEVSEEYRLVPDTLYLTVNYIDRYLSGNEVNRQRLQLLGVACMLIASKYEEICAPQVEEFCYITDNTYVKEEVLQMEAAVLRHLKFEMTAPTVKCFLRRFVRVAQQSEGVPSLQLEFLASYIAELTLLEYGFLSYAPSLIAASAVFLAKFILQPMRKPWDATLAHYTLYKPSELSECVKGLHHLFCNSPSSALPAIREKYSQHKYKFVAKKYCPPTIPRDFFLDPIG